MKLLWISCGRSSAREFTAAGERLLKRTFGQNSLTGFSIETFDGSVLQGTYIEKTEFTETLTDPFGEPIRIPRIRYERVQFRLAHKYPELEIVEPPRSVKNCLSEISRAFDFSATIQPITVDPTQWHAATAESFKRSVVTKLAIREIIIAPGVWGSLVVDSDVDVQKNTKDFMQTKVGQIDKLGFNAQFRTERVYCELSASARARIEAHDTDELRLILRNALRTASAIDIGRP